MKYLVPIPPETAADFKCQKETGMDYQIVSVRLKDNGNSSRGHRGRIVCRQRHRRSLSQP